MENLKKNPPHGHSVKYFKAPHGGGSDAESYAGCFLNLTASGYPGYVQGMKNHLLSMALTVTSLSFGCTLATLSFPPFPGHLRKRKNARGVIHVRSEKGAPTEAQVHT